MKLSLLAALALLPLAACTTVSPEAKVRTALVEAGLSPRVAGCMAERMVDRLSYAELRKLKALNGLKKNDPRDMTPDEFLHRIGALEDPHILKVVTRAGLGCAISGG